MKNIRIFIVSIIAITLVVGTMWQPSISYGASLDYVKVGLTNRNAVSEANISADGGLAIANYSDSGFTDVTPILANGVTVKVATAKNENGVIVIKDESQTTTLATLAENQGIVSSDHNSGGLIKFENSQYRGGLLLKKNLEKIGVINFLDLEQYVYGVLAAEIGTGSPIEAIKAQAVAARSFAEGANRESHNSIGFDVCTTTCCQVYKGVTGEHPNTIKATDETKGLMIYSEGKPVQAYYAKNSGGHTQNSEDVWVTPLPYLKGVEDTYAPDYLWEATMTFAELKSKLESGGYSPGEIQSVSVTKRSDAGAVHTLEIKGSDNTVKLQKDDLRISLGGSIVKSLMFNFVGSHSSGNQSTGKPTSEFVYVISEVGKTTKVETDSVYASNGTATVKWKDAGNSSVNGEALETVTGGTLYFKGNGYGHGVGMQQDGAIAMGEQGFTYDEILKFYYTGIEIK